MAQRRHNLKGEGYIKISQLFTLKIPVNIQTAKNFIQQHKNIYFLGFGFDENNLKLLGLDSLQDGEPKNIFYTNYDESKNIDNRVNNLFRGHTIIPAPSSIEEALSKHFELF